VVVAVTFHGADWFLRGMAAWGGAATDAVGRSSHATDAARSSNDGTDLNGVEWSWNGGRLMDVGNDDDSCCCSCCWWWCGGEGHPLRRGMGTREAAGVAWLLLPFQPACEVDSAM